MTQLVASMSGVVLGGVVMVVGSNFARGKIFTASIGSVDSLYPSVFYLRTKFHIQISKFKKKNIFSQRKTKNVRKRYIIHHLYKCLTRSAVAQW